MSQRLTAFPSRCLRNTGLLWNIVQQTLLGRTALEHKHTRPFVQGVGLSLLWSEGLAVYPSLPSLAPLSPLLCYIFLEYSPEVSCIILFPFLV